MANLSLSGNRFKIVSDFRMTANVTYTDLAKSLKPAKKSTSSARIDSLAFSYCGDYLVTANDNDELELYQVADGSRQKGVTFLIKIRLEIIVKRIKNCLDIS